MDTRQKLKALIQQGITQKVIAEETGVPQPTISRIVSGRHKSCLASNADAISAFYLEKTEGEAA